MIPEECSKCGAPWTSGKVPNYDHIHRAETMPRARRTESHIVLHGYAVGLAGMGGGIGQTWVFFEHLEPALVFGRAGRMSSHDISSYGVYEAARETRYDEHRRGDVTTLHVNVAADSLDRRQGEKKVFARWLQGVESESAHFEPPHRRAAARVGR
ncbi:hypothetical protein ABZU32_35625 [Sphaerisporangium sp. NPDC005288]|uniref:hypothetical protein n=1 Tax=Sphaerisporangium sp. NPDC005288 TaxID=3155114 RepID=UPI0033A9BFC9